MSINRQMKTYTLNRKTDTTDEYRQIICEYAPLSSIDVAIYSNDEEKLLNNPMYSNVNYLALTKEKNIQKHDRLDNSYEVVKVINDNRYIQLYLEEVI